MFDSSGLSAIATSGENGVYAYFTDDTVAEVKGDGYFPTPPEDRTLTPRAFILVTAIDGSATINIIPEASNALPSKVMTWQGVYDSATEYNPYDVVTDTGWTMVANKRTNDTASPTPIGEQAFIYSGTLVAGQDTAKTVMFGTRYSLPSAGKMSALRVDVVAGNRYDVSIVMHPLSDTPLLKRISEFTAGTTGWLELHIAPELIVAGTTFDVVCEANEPDPTPTVITGNWDYSKPNNVTPPTSGQVTHSTKELGVLYMSKTDNDAGDRSSELEALTVGDIIDLSGLRWAIQSIQDSGTYMTYGISPSTQASVAGVQSFSIETVTATPITTGTDVNYNQSNVGIWGLKMVDGSYLDIVPDDNQYGVDIELQQVVASPDWDALALYGG